MNSKVIWIGLFSLQLYAGMMGEVHQNNPIPWVSTFSIGPTWTNPGSQ